jgi:hypothetical protein
MRRALDLTVYIGEDDDAFAVMADLNRVALTHMHQGRDVTVSVYQVPDSPDAQVVQFDDDDGEVLHETFTSSSPAEIINDGLKRAFRGSTFDDQ